MQSIPEKHYVILVHGTWGYESGVADRKAWHEEGSEFRSGLQQQLQRFAGNGAEWRLRSFTWPECDNNHAHRLQAGRRLAGEIAALRLAEPDATIHFVAHSHGGNVVLEALTWWFPRLYGQAFDACLHAREKAEKDHRDATSAAAGSDGRVERKADEAPPPEALRSALEGVLRDAATAALAREAPEWAAGDRKPKTELDHGALAAVARAELLGELDRDRLAKAAPGRSRQEALVRALQDKMDSVSRIVGRKFGWAKAAAIRFASHPRAHGIGRLVFLGTPFFHKRWDCNRSRLRGLVERTWRVLRVAASMLLLVYVICAVLALFQAGRDAWNPLHWPWWVHLVAGFFGVAVVLPGIVKATGEQLHRDTNLYFDRGSATLRHLGAFIGRAERRIPCLTVSAGRMDEALLAMSVEPVVRGLYRPRLREWLGLSSGGEAQEDSDRIDLPAGVDWGTDRGAVVNLLARGVGRVVDLTLGQAWEFNRRWLTGPIWRWLVAQTTERYVLSTVRRVSEMAATGLPAADFRGAGIRVSNRLGVDDFFDETPMNVVEKTLASNAFRQVARDPERYAFLRDGAAMPDPEEGRHFLYGALKKEKIEDADLLKTALVVDERVQEAMGAVELAHSTYYGSEEVIGHAARFLVTGERPEGAQKAPCATPVPDAPSG